eukprot:136833-Alexandrium_andersonii.AAC.1
MRHGVAGVAKRNKAFRMQWCLSEARRELNRKFLRQATSITYHQDARGNKLCSRFSACDQKLRVRKGIIGQISHLKLGTGSTALVKASKLLLKRFCTGAAGAPPKHDGSRVPDAGVDWSLYRAISAAVEVFDADAAADENVAGRQMAGDFFP